MAFLLATSSLFADDFLQLASKGSPAQIQSAIRAGAKLSDPSPDGLTALMMAASGNTDAEAIAVLVKPGANVNETA